VFQLVETKFLKITFYNLNNILPFASGEKSLVPFEYLVLMPLLKYSFNTKKDLKTLASDPKILIRSANIKILNRSTSLKTSCNKN
jgi:hypothetical protein